MKRGPATLCVVFALVSASTAMADTTVFFSDFEGTIPAEVTAPGCVLSGVQGYAGLGPAENQFGGTFLRYTSVPLHDTELTLTGLPAHDQLDLSFLLAVIDSWDGTELLQVSIDGVTVFSHWFQLAVGDQSSYVHPPGGLLSSGTNLGFTCCTYYERDRAYDMGIEPVFQVAHTASSVTIAWRLSAVSGPAAAQWQGGTDESWAIDNLRVSVSGEPTAVGDSPAVPAALTLLPNHPNPFSAMTRFRAAAPAAGRARVEVYDVSGRRLVDRVVELSSGWQNLEFDGRDAAGALLPSGVYFCRLNAAGASRTRKFVIAR